MPGIRYVFATASATLAHQGERFVIRPGEPWDASDPLVKRYPEFFTDHPNAVRTTRGGDYIALDTDGELPPVERATRAPGEKRRRTSRR